MVVFNTIIGQVARKDKFYPRTEITNKIIAKLRKDSNLLLAAPRRVGKTSILLNLHDREFDDLHFVYFISESVNDENEYYRKLHKHIIESFDDPKKKYFNKISSFLKEQASRIKEFNTDGIALGDSRINYFDEFQRLIKGLPDNDTKIILMIDEFSQTIENIQTDQGINAAKHFLDSNRTLRQMPELFGKIQFIYAGSIGLENITNRLNHSQSINDLVSVEVSPLNNDEANDLIDKIIIDSHVEFNLEERKYFLENVRWLIPFYIQLLLDEIENILNREKCCRITKEIIDFAITEVLTKRNNFEHWFERLRKSFGGPEFSFIKDVLNIASAKNQISSAEITDLAVKYDVLEKSRDIINSLKYDGYIKNSESNLIYVYNAPILKLWWYNNVAN